MENELISRIGEYVDPFLTKWAEGMDKAGYLKYTTAKREDCIKSFWDFLKPIMEHIKTHRGLPSFAQLLQNNGGWANILVAVSRRHRFRGVTADMFLGCFKTLVHSVEGLILEMEGSIREKLDALSIVRRWSDAYETIFMGDWTAMTQQEAVQKLADTNRQLTLGKNKYENILAATSDVVLVTDAAGKVTEANAAAYGYRGHGDLLGRYFWETLDLEGRDIAEVTRYYGVNESHEINLFDESSFFKLRIIPLQSVSLASRGYMVLLTDVTCLVRQRESLEKTVSERTMALDNTEKQYMSLFQAAGESILLIDIHFRVVQANQRSGEVFGLEPKVLQGLHCNELCHSDAQINLEQAIRNLDEGEIWEGEMKGRRADGKVFPMAVTINRIDLDSRTVFHVLVRDVTKQKELEQNLRSEKRQLEELNITLRNVMKSIDQESQELQKAVSQKVEDLLLPALDKVHDEPTHEVRKGYLDIIRDQLTKLCSGTRAEQNAHLLKLTPTEMKICQFIQAGSPTKDIAESMCLSVDTIQTHRKNIRKKLGLRGRNVNLFTFLNTPEPREASEPANA